MATETFKYIDDTAANGDAQVSTAHLQRMAENTSYLRHMRGPTSTVSWAQRYGSDATKPPKLGLAQWAAFGPIPYYVPDYGANSEGRHTVNVTLQGVVDGDGVRVACISRQGHIGTLGWDAIEPIAQNVTTTGAVTVTFADVPVRPGYNDLYVLVCSNATWQSVNYGTDWTSGAPANASFIFTDVGLAQQPRLGIAAGGGDLATDCPAITDSVPYVAVRLGVDATDKSEDMFSSVPLTIGWCQNNGGAFPGAWIAENDGTIDSRTWTTGGYRYYWSLLGTLEIHGISITPYATVNWSNDTMVRWYQRLGWNVAAVTWGVSCLQNIRQPQTIGATQPQLGQDWPGVWAIGGPIEYNVTDYANDAVGGIREAAFTLSTPQPDGPVWLEADWRSVWDDLGVQFRNGGRPALHGSCTFKLEVYDPDAGAVVATAEPFDLRPVNLTGALQAVDFPVYQTSGWVWQIRRIQQGAGWTLAVSNGQPWSHDGCTALADVGWYWTRCVLRVDVSGLDADKRYIARIKAHLTVPTTIEAYSALVTGPMAIRLDWGVTG